MAGNRARGGKGMPYLRYQQCSCTARYGMFSHLMIMDNCSGATVDLKTWSASQATSALETLPE